MSQLSVIVVFFLTINSALSCCADDLQPLVVSRAFFRTQNGNQSQTTFEPEQKIYFFIEFKDPPNIPTELTVKWVTPSGEIERIHTQQILPTKRKDIIYYSWLKLIKKGLFSRTFTGEDYKPEYEGQWTVYVYQQTVIIGKYFFIIHNLN